MRSLRQPRPVPSPTHPAVITPTFPEEGRRRAATTLTIDNQPILLTQPRLDAVELSRERQRKTDWPPQVPKGPISRRSNDKRGRSNSRLSLPILPGVTIVSILRGESTGLGGLGNQH